MSVHKEPASGSPRTGKGLVSLLSGAIAAQLVTLAALPLISRLFSPENFGYLSLVLALAGAVAPAAMLRLETAAMLPERLEEVRAIFWLAIASGITVSILYCVALSAISSVGPFGLASFPWIPFWVASYVLSSSVFTLMSQLVLRKKLYATVGRRSLLKATATVLAQVGIGLAHKATSAGLLVGPLIGNLIGIASMAKQSWEYVSRIPHGEFVPVLRKYWRFPAFFAPSALLNSLGLQVPLVYFVAAFGLAAGGQLGMAERVVALPITLVGAAVGQLVEAEISGLIRRGGSGIHSVYMKYSVLLALVGIGIGVVGFGLGGVVVPWVLGNDWAAAGVLVQILSINGAVRLVASPLSRVILLLQRTLANTVLDVVRVLLMITAIGVSRLLALDFLESVLLVYSSLTLTYLLTWCYGFRLVRQESSGSR